ncbi:MAG: hypothetical protein HC802_20660 [Caldilineaceae bacterium]|nr:hypothetical protein [Caldilineaceae bacterium]
MIIKQIDTIPLNMHLLPELTIHMQRSAHGGRVVLYRVTLENGAVGYGEDVGAADDVSHLVGENALAGLRHIQHSGVQMACFDAVGRALDVPAHQLMGRQVRDKVPFAYWTIDLPPDLWAQQTQRAAGLGYRVYKFKCRPGGIPSNRSSAWPR